MWQLCASAPSSVTSRCIGPGMGKPLRLASAWDFARMLSRAFCWSGVACFSSVGSLQYDRFSPWTGSSAPFSMIVSASALSMLCSSSVMFRLRTETLLRFPGRGGGSAVFCGADELIE